MISDTSPLVECTSHNSIFTPFVGWKNQPKHGISFTDILLAVSTHTVTIVASLVSLGS
jgi:hypothetical protein